MALNKDILGQALYDRSITYNDVVIDTNDAAAVATYRLNFWKAIADEIIIHFKNNGVLTIPGLGLTAGATPVTGSSVTGNIS